MRNLQILFLLLILNYSCAAQSNIPSNAKEILISKTWKIDGLQSDVYKITFTNTKMIMYTNGNLIGEKEYYFSNDLNQCSETGFVQANVGNAATGKYIVTKNSCVELIVVNGTKLIMKSLSNGTITSASSE